MKNLLAAALLLGSSSALAADGSAIFTGKACTACHSPDKDQTAMGLGPSLQQISAAYKDDKAGLIAFFDGGQPKVKPELYPVMQGQQAITKALTAEEKGALADWMLTH